MMENRRDNPKRRNELYDQMMEFPDDLEKANNAMLRFLLKNRDYSVRDICVALIAYKIKGVGLELDYIEGVIDSGEDLSSLLE